MKVEQIEKLIEKNREVGDLMRQAEAEKWPPQSLKFAKAAAHLSYELMTELLTVLAGSAKE